MRDPKIICLMGPTASGKTQLAIDLLQVLPCEIISVDSAMVYRGMDIGTAKPEADVLAIAPHHLIDIRDPAEPYSAADFCDDAVALINDIISRDKIPLLVGGTMLYFRALQQGLSDLPSADSAVREKILEEASEKGWDALHERLAQVDPAAALRIHPHDKQRLQRALEVFEMTGQSITDLQLATSVNELKYPFVNIAVSPSNRAVLHERIAKRFMQMIDQGFLAEVEQLMQRRDLHIDMPSMRAVGYRQAWAYLEGQFGMTELNEKAIAATRQLAKRQLTWLRHWKSPITFFESEATDVLPQVLAFLQTQGIK